MLSNNVNLPEGTDFHQWTWCKNWQIVYIWKSNHNMARSSMIFLGSPIRCLLWFLTSEPLDVGYRVVLDFFLLLIGHWGRMKSSYMSWGLLFNQVEMQYKTTRTVYTDNVGLSIGLCGNKSMPIIWASDWNIHTHEHNYADVYKQKGTRDFSLIVQQHEINHWSVNQLLQVCSTSTKKMWKLINPLIVKHVNGKPPIYRFLQLYIHIYIRDPHSIYIYIYL